MWLTLVVETVMLGQELFPCLLLQSVVVSPAATDSAIKKHF